MLKAGAQIGSYRVVREIGHGAMGIVYEGVHQDIERRAAIKVLQPDQSRDPQFLARLRNEARATNRVRHPGLVEIFEFGALPEGPAYIIMEYLEGESLRERLLRVGGALPDARALDIARQVATALASAHEGSVVHRDLKPDNLMLVPDVERPGWDRVKILDFGIAKLGEQAPAAARAPITESGLVMGTPEYMAPEQCLGAAQVDGQADVYALGVILYELLCGRRPFDAESRLVLMTQHLSEAPLPPSQRRPDLDPQLEGLVLAMLAKTPEQRPDMAAVAAELSTATPPAPPEAARPGAPAAAPPTLVPARGAPGFIAGPPIIDPARFYGRAREVKRIFELWRQRPLQNAAIIGPRRSGKTSLLHYLRGVHGCDHLRPGQRGEYLPRGARPRFVLVDFQDPRLGTRDGLLRHLLLGLGLPPPSGVCDLDGFLWTLTDRLSTPAVFLLDEVDLALSRYPELDDSFWEALRSIAGSQVGGNLGFVLASHERPYELAQSTGRGSPFFNIFGYAATLGPLTEPEARDLIAGAPAPFAERDAAWILEESGRWPMLLQILCRERLVALEEGEVGDGWRADALQQLAPFRHLLGGA